MVRRTRRSVLQASGVGLGLLGSGCLGLSPSGDSTRSPSNTSTPTPAGSETPTDDASTTGYSTVDERVTTTPPGSPALDPSGSWPASRFDSGNTGWNPDGTGLRDGTTYWRLDAGGSASVARGTLYNTADGDDETDVLTFRDPTTGRVETSSDLVPYGVNPPPVVGDDNVFVSTFIEVFCFDAQSGEQVWRGPEMDGIQSQPTIQEERVFVNSSGYKDVDPHLRAFDAASGDELWRYETGHFSDSTPAVDDDRVFVSSEGGLHAINAASGEESFLVPDVAARRFSPVVAGGTVFTLSSENFGKRDELVALDAADGTEKWRVAVSVDSPPVVTDDAVYASVEEGIAELDRADGSVLASTSTQAAPVGLVGDVLYLESDGTISALDVTDDLTRLWWLTTEEVQISDTIGRAIYHITPVDGAVYVSARDAFYGIGPTDA